VRRSAALLVALALAPAACTGDEERAGAPAPRTPEQVVREWSRQLNRGDDLAAADLFAMGARIEQSGFVLRIRTRQDAYDWNHGLPCSGSIVALDVRGNEATATFVLSDRETSPCDGPGAHVTAVFTVQAGKIVRFRQLEREAPPDGTV